MLDIGCGGGGAAGTLIQIAFAPENLFGIDLLPKNIVNAKRKYASCNFAVGDGRRVDYCDESFDLVLESGIFIRLSDDEASDIACEMIRVVKPGGFVMLIDWRYGPPARNQYYALAKRRRSALFPGLEPIAAIPEALLSPIGRTVSAHVPSVYFLLRKLISPLIGQFA